MLLWALTAALFLQQFPPSFDTATGATANDWPGIRGPAWSGHSSAQGLADSWPADGPPVLWVRELGDGYSSFAVWNDRAATMYQTASEQLVICLDVNTGRTIWEHRCGWPYERGGRYPGPRATPAWVAGRLYFCSADGLVGCLDATTGKRLWAVHLQTDLQAEIPGFGYSCSPTVVSGLVLLPVGGRNSAILALDAVTGQVRWRGGDEDGSYAPVLPITFRGRQLAVACLSNHVVCHDLQTGTRLWQLELSRGYDEHSCWPLYQEPHLWISGPFKKGGMLLELTEDAATPVRDLRRGDPLSNDIFSSVLSQGAIFGFDVLEPQSSAWRSTRGMFRCIDFATGRELWSAGTKRPMRDAELPLTTGGDWPGHASVLHADNRLLVFNDLGELLMLRDSRERCEILARASVLGGALCWTQPALSGPRLLARNQHRAVCVWLGPPDESVAGNATRGNTQPLQLSDIPRGRRDDLLARRLGLSPGSELIPPSPRQLHLWFQQGLLVLGGSAITAVLLAGVTLPLRRGSDSMATRALRCLPGVVLVAAIATPAAAAAADCPGVFTWPLALCAAFRLLIGESALRSAATELKGRAALYRRLRLAGLGLVSLVWWGFCRRFGLVFELAFLAGFVCCIPWQWLPSLQGRQSWLWLPAGTLRLGLEYSGLFWAGAALMGWRE
ncbi:MAG: PQQ-binding-like beta-propeller repeat protein [Planctomycetota bacterium]